MLAPDAANCKREPYVYLDLTNREPPGVVDGNYVLPYRRTVARYLVRPWVVLGKPRTQTPSMPSCRSFFLSRVSS